MASCVMTARNTAFTVPLFLVPATTTPASAARTAAYRFFSTSPARTSRRTTGPNKERGVSAIRSKNPKPKTEVYKYPLPEPIIDPERRALFKTRPDHGLWGFFEPKKRPMIAPIEEAAHGRAWTVRELGESKSFQDLHRLYWVCVLERNRIATRLLEMRRTRAGYGSAEAKTRYDTVKKTMINIRTALARRHASWVDARSILEEKDIADLDIDDEPDDYFDAPPAEVEETKELAGPK